MTSKQPPEEKVLVCRCLAIVFKEKKHKRGTGASTRRGSYPAKPHQEAGEDDGVDADKKPLAKELNGGRDFFEEFVAENKCCYWNPHLEESVKNLKHVGFVEPCTLLVGGRDIYLDTVKGAWARRALRAPTAHSIHRLGEVGGMEMQAVPQTQFTPLPEALCLIISDLHKEQQGTSFDGILDRLKDIYRGVQQPAEQVVYEMLANLIKEHKIYHTGDGYFILTPDKYPLNGCVTVQDNRLVIGSSNAVIGGDGGPTIYIPLLPAAKQTDVRSISIQTEEAPVDANATSDTSVTDKPEQSPPSEKGDKSSKGKKFERSLSMREKKNEKKATEKKEKLDKEAFQRSTSLRLGEEKGKALVKDINLKTSDIHQDKDKGEKTSLLNKLFGRSKAKKSAASEDKPAMECATFSAQFPPPEWEWYESQMQKAEPSSSSQQPLRSSQLPTQPPHLYAQPQHPHVTKSQTWHHLRSAPYAQDAGVQSDYDPYDELTDHRGLQKQEQPRCPMHKSWTLPAGGDASPLVQQYLHQQHQFYQERPPKSTSSHSQDDSWSSQPGQSKSPLRREPVVESKPSSKSKRSRQKSAEGQSGERHNADRSHAKKDKERGTKDKHKNAASREANALPGSTSTPQQQHRDVRPKITPNESFALSSDCTPSEDCAKCPSDESKALQSLPEQPSSAQQQPQPQPQPQPQDGANLLLNNAFMGENQGESLCRPNHVTKAFRKYREMKTASFCNNDISVEYNGKMPRKDAGYTASRDSGVNCVGLGNNGGHGSVPDSSYTKANMKELPSNNTTQWNNLSPHPSCYKPVNTHNNALSNNSSGTQEIVVEAQIHRPNVPETPPHHHHHHQQQQQEDSGFNSPKMLDCSNGQLNNSPASNVSSSTGLQSNLSYVSGVVEKAEVERPVAASYESIGSSDKYPSIAHQSLAQSSGSGLSSLSESSKLTVVEVGKTGHLKARKVPPPPPKRSSSSPPQRCSSSPPTTLRAPSPVRQKGSKKEPQSDILFLRDYELVNGDSLPGAPVAHQHDARLHRSKDKVPHVKSRDKSPRKPAEKIHEYKSYPNAHLAADQYLANGHVAVDKDVGRRELKGATELQAVYTGSRDCRVDASRGSHRNQSRQGANNVPDTHSGRPKNYAVVGVL